MASGITAEKYVIKSECMNHQVRVSLLKMDMAEHINKILMLQSTSIHHQEKYCILCSSRALDDWPEVLSATCHVALQAFLPFVWPATRRKLPHHAGLEACAS